MNEEFEKQLSAFIAAGNEVVGRPARANGAFTLTFGKGSGSRIVFGDGCILNHMALNVEAGNATFIIGPGSHIRGRYFIGNKSTIEFSENTVINRHVQMTATEGADISIGASCLISDISMSTTDWHSIIDVETGDRINPAKSIKIEDNVWLGEGVTIQKGVTIGSGCIIGARSVVTKPIRPNCLAVGIPAKVIRENVTWNRKLIETPSLPAAEY